MDDASSFVPRLFQAGADGIRTLQIEASTLEDAYFQLAGTPLRAATSASSVEPPQDKALSTPAEPR